MKNLALLARREFCRMSLRAAGAAAITFAGPATAQPSRPAAAPLKVGFVFVSPISDGGWTYQHNQGRLHLERELGERVATRVVENVAEGPDAERVIRDLAAQGHALIFATSFGYMEPTLRVAREFPQVAFEHAGGYRTASNVATYNARHYEGRYLAGLVAGTVSSTGTLGYVAAMPIPEVLQGLNAFALGARAANPDARVRLVWTNAWHDPGRERDAAFALIAQGADVLTHHTDSPAVPQAAEARGAWVIGYHSDMSRHAPTRHLLSVTHHWGEYYVQRAQAMLRGEWRSHALWGGIANGFVRLGPIAQTVPANALDRMRAAQQQIAAGKLHPFAGPVRDNTGTVRIEAATPVDGELSRMDWLADGVAGRLPTR